MMATPFFFLLSILFGVAVGSDEYDPPHLCIQDERSALWELKQSFVNDSNSQIAFASWKLDQGESGDCCRSWNGVECDAQSGHVTALDLSGSSLFGSITSDSSLFRLLHLQKLNLAYNNFNYSLIPASLANLSNLTHLNLAQSTFAGQIPSQILLLSTLSSLDLSENGFLELKTPNLGTLLHSLPKLEHLNLNFINMPQSTLPRLLSNYTSLRSLRLQNCRLHGDFPTGIFRLPNLHTLDLSYNTNLTYSLPHDINSPLQMLYLTSTNLSAHIPPSLGKLTNLTSLYLSYNNLVGQIPSSILNLTRLVVLTLAENQLTGSIPPRIFTLPQLEYLDLAQNHLSGTIPSLVAADEAKLIGLDLSSNQLQGPIPDSIFRLKNLQSLKLQSNNLTGTLQIDKFLLLKNLTSLALSSNRFSLLTESVNLTSLHFTELFLSSCNLTRFPEFLQHQQDLVTLDLSSNRIHGLIPEWVFNLQILNLSNNLLTGFQKYPVEFSSASLSTLDLSSNLLQGPLPIPPASVIQYMVSSNNLSGDVSERICQLTSLEALDLSFNNFTGMVPKCFSSSSYLKILTLRRNNFHGTIPHNFTSECSLQMVDLSENQLQGKLPRSLANCGQLQFLAAANNQLNDTFPDWLASLPELSVLILRANSFHGVVGEPNTDSDFPKLRIIDISRNLLTGKLPSKYFSLWHSMEVVNHDEGIGYMEQYLLGFSHAYQYYAFSLTMQNKGTETDYQKILDTFVAVDLSGNRFKGEIPQLIGNLKGVHSLNLSNNALTGRIPRSLENMKELESLDLSKNELSGEIPQELRQLSFLAVFNVSYNKLTGRVPQGQQFDTFQDSYFGNPGLCGDLLSRKCRSPDETTPDTTLTSEEEESESVLEFGWKIMVAGYAGGLVVGLVGGNILFTKKQHWFMSIFEKKKQKNKRKAPRNMQRRR